IPASSAEPSSARCGREERQSFSGRIPPSAAPPRLSVRHLGRCPSALSCNLEDLASRSAIYRARLRSGSPGKEETYPDVGASPWEARLRGHHHSQKPTCGQALYLGLGEDFRRSVIAFQRTCETCKNGLRSEEHTSELQ